MPDLNAWYAARDLMRSALIRDLHGGSDDEILLEPPLDRFIVGVLHPSATPVDDAADESDVDSSSSHDSDFDPAVSFAHLRKPSSMGLTFAVDPAVTGAVHLTVRAERYVPEEAESSPRDGAPVTAGSSQVESAIVRRETRRAERWRLERVEVDDVVVDCRAHGTAAVPLAVGLELRTVVRSPVAGVTSITVALVDVFPTVAGTADEWCWFRPKLVARVEEGCFVRRDLGSGVGRDRDERSSDLLYRSVANLAVGHGVSVTWAEGEVVDTVETTYFPAVEVPIARAERPDVPTLGMRRLGSGDDWSSLEGLVTAYRSWIDDQESMLAGLDDGQRDTAREHIRAARTAADRMDAGIRCLESSKDAAEAFRAMNRAMQEQRSRQVMIRAKTTEPGPEEHFWRPFQMAFVLINLESLVDAESEDREIADLLWFPTGGGKTEAYLGLIALVVVLRRLRGAPGAGGGVAVLMRYTLRLLTVQQFERAAGLVCALERWRRVELPDSAPISLGLWVGQGATPNNVKDAAAVLRSPAVAAGDSDRGNPRQLLNCPWCGADLPVESYTADVVSDRLTIRCSNVLCEFRSGIPAFVIDSDVFRERPSLVIGTVDKFAMMAWNERAGRLFGTDGEVDPPDMIVQDELHLISGPLGTLVGLYETAVDAACTGKARPKLVASTATIRRASDQVRAVFARDSQQFPPPGIDARDSFFAVNAERLERGTREYVGVMAPGQSHSTLLVRSYAALLQAGRTIDVDDGVRDAYWTLLGYFTSLQVLGAAYIQTLDNVPDRIKVIAIRESVPQREIGEPRELTSRKRSSEIPAELAALATSCLDPNSPDVVLATNMISVGMDVDRLGLMVLMGQPQTTSEYIQATSRVGRLFPGLVVTLFHAGRSRDLSHFESFTTYHRALYRQVEATGATPFAPRAMDRGLHGVLVSLARLLIPGAAGERSVLVPPTSDKNVDILVDVFRARARAVAPEAEDAVVEAVERLLDAWRSEEGSLTKYSGWDGAAGSLLVPAGGGPGQRVEARDITFPVDLPSWSTLTSLRNVDAESTLFLARRMRKAL